MTNPATHIQPGHLHMAEAWAGLRDRAHHMTAGVRARFTRAEKSTEPRHYPDHRYFIEHAAMSREMYHL